MTDLMMHRDRLRTLGQQLVAEYGGALPPGRILALLYRADRLVAGVPASRRAGTCEAVVRRMLTDGLARESADAS